MVSRYTVKNIHDRIIENVKQTRNGEIIIGDSVCSEGFSYDLMSSENKFIHRHGFETTLGNGRLYNYDILKQLTSQPIILDKKIAESWKEIIGEDNENGLGTMNIDNRRSVDRLSIVDKEVNEWGKSMMKQDFIDYGDKSSNNYDKILSSKIPRIDESTSTINRTRSLKCLFDMSNTSNIE